jgi:hypothetical protein
LESRQTQNFPVRVRTSDVYRIKYLGEDDTTNEASCFLLGDKLVTARHCAPSRNYTYWLCTPLGNYKLKSDTLVVHDTMDISWFSSFYEDPEKPGRWLNLISDLKLRPFSMGKNTRPGICTIYCWVVPKEKMLENDMWENGQPSKQHGVPMYTGADYVGTEDGYHYFSGSSTEQGWSGCPVIDNVTQNVVGVHSGCGNLNGVQRNRAVDIQVLQINKQPTGVARSQ